MDYFIRLSDGSAYQIGSADYETIVPLLRVTSSVRSFVPIKGKLLNKPGGDSDVMINVDQIVAIGSFRG